MQILMHCRVVLNQKHFRKLDFEVQVAAVMDTDANTITDLLQADAAVISVESLQDNQQKDPDLLQLIQYTEEGTLPTSQQRACNYKLVLQNQLFVMLDGILYYVDHKHANRRLLMLPKHMRERVIEENHRGKFRGYFSGTEFSRVSFLCSGGKVCTYKDIYVIVKAWLRV